MDELRPGLWTWTGRHPDWRDDPHWGPEVRSYALRTDDGVVLFDPIAPPGELTRDANVQVVVTAEWHSRDAERLGLKVLTDLPAGIDEHPAFFPGERTLWLASHHALVAGDSLPGAGPMPDAWLKSEWATSTREEYNAKLRPLLELPVERVLASHGGPFDRNALERALA